MLLLKVVHPLTTYKHKKFHGTTLTGASFASTSDVLTSAMVEYSRRYGIKKYGAHVTFNDCGLANKIY
jgi:hypothetical protein